MDQPPAQHTSVATVTIIGAFTVIITALITHQSLAEWLIVLVTGSVGSVTGFYFGASAATGPLTMAHNTINRLTTLLNPPPHTAAPTEHDPTALNSKE